MANLPNITWDTPDAYAAQFDSIIASVRAKPDPQLYPSDPTWFDHSKAAFKYALGARHVLYWVNRAPSYTNGQQTDPSDTDSNLSLATIQSQNPDLDSTKVLSKITSTTKYAGLAIGVATSLGHAGVGFLAAGTAVGGVLSVASIAAFGVGLAVMPVMMILAHHAAAVAAEHKNNAQAIDYANAYLNEIQPLMAQAQVTSQEFEQFATSLMRDFSQLNQGSYKRGNAAWALRNELAIVLELYRRINNNIQSIAQGLASQARTPAPQASPATPPLGSVAPPAQTPVSSAGAGLVQASVSGGLPSGLILLGAGVVVAGVLIAE